MKNTKNFLHFLNFIFLALTILAQSVFAQNYDDLNSCLLKNFPKTFEGKEIHPRTYSLGLAIINQITEDLRKMEFDEKSAIWLHANDYVLYDARSAKRIGNTYFIAYKTEDNKVLGTYTMNCENPVNNRLLHTSYRYSGGSYSIKQKITLHNFSHLVCRPIEKVINRF